MSDLKQYLILNDFPSVNEAITQNSNVFKEMQVRFGSEQGCMKFLISPPPALGGGGVIKFLGEEYQVVKRGLWKRMSVRGEGKRTENLGEKIKF